MDSVLRVQDNYCTDCIYSEYVELKDCLRIKCNHNQHDRSRTRSYALSVINYKRLGSKACLSFQKKGE